MPLTEKLKAEVLQLFEEIDECQENGISPQREQGWRPQMGNQVSLRADATGNKVFSATLSRIAPASTITADNPRSRFPPLNPG